MHSWWKRGGKINVAICWFSVHCGLYGYVDCESQAHPGRGVYHPPLHCEFDEGSEAVKMIYKGLQESCSQVTCHPHD